MLLCRSTTTGSGEHGEHLWCWTWRGRDVVDMVGGTQEEGLGMEVPQRVVLGLDDVTGTCTSLVCPGHVTNVLGTSVVGGPTDPCRAQCWWCQVPGSR